MCDMLHTQLYPATVEGFDMSNVKLSCDETPLAWPSSVAIDDLTSCSTCGFTVQAPSPGSLQILTRRQGSGVGDGYHIASRTSPNYVPQAGVTSIGIGTDAGRNSDVGIGRCGSELQAHCGIQAGTGPSG
jgi:hypothetical protein